MNKTTYWVDSLDICYWICNQSQKYKLFMSYQLQSSKVIEPICKGYIGYRQKLFSPTENLKKDDVVFKIDQDAQRRQWKAR